MKDHFHITKDYLLELDFNISFQNPEILVKSVAKVVSDCTLVVSHSRKMKSVFQKDFGGIVDACPRGLRHPKESEI